MNLRAKLYPAFVVACIAALALFCFVQRERDVRAAEETLRADMQWRASQLARAVESQRAARVRELSDLEQSSPVQDFFIQRGRLTPEQARIAAIPPTQPAPSTAPEASVSVGLREQVESFFARDGGDAYAAITLVTGTGNSVVVRLEPPHAPGRKLTVKTGDVVLREKGVKGLLSETDEAHRESGFDKWAITSQCAFAYAMQVVRENEGSIGTFIAEAKLDTLVGRAAEGFTDAGGERRQLFQLIALDRTGRIVYHTNPALKFQMVANSLPEFNAVAADMSAGRRGTRMFDGADGAHWLAAYEPVGNLDLSVAVVANDTAATARVRRGGLVFVVLSLAFALTAAALVITREVRAVRRIERVARAARAVAEGDMDERLETSAHDRTRAIAESFNLMTERLRGHIRREAENRQFQAFIRLSAMLTHDLKNAITGLSMLVSNMERQFHREEFRADAISSLREATEKLRSLVARLNKPAETLSGEYRRALQPVDLVAVIRRVIESAAANSSFHEVEQRLPDTLEVVVDAERIERVIENLIINAREAMGAKAGKLTVEAGRENDEQVFVTVADTGAGMSAEFIRTKLFQPFATTKKQGLGLGLYTCREIIEAHGGSIKVESEQGSGTRFRIVLPSRPASLRRDQKTI